MAAFSRKIADHKAFYDRLHAGGNLESTCYFEKQALTAHALAVHQALLDSRMSSLTFGFKLNPAAQHFMFHGVGRRLGMIWASYRSLMEIADIEREKTLGNDEVAIVSRDLNVIYLNIVGTLDNYAWALLHQHQPQIATTIAKTRVGFFSSAIRELVDLPLLWDAADKYADWHKELKERRDPAAHRIPLSTPPCILTKPEGEEYERIERLIADARNRMDFDEHDRLASEQRKLGHYVPLMVHHPDSDKVNIWPTVPEDLGVTIDLADAVHATIA